MGSKKLLKNKFDKQFNIEHWLFVACIFIFSIVLTFFLGIGNPFSIKLLCSLWGILFYWSLRSISKILFDIFVILSFFVACLLYPTLVVYGKIDDNYISSVLYSNLNEAISYIKIVPYYIYLHLFCLGFCCFVMIRIKEQVKLPKIIRFMFLLFILASPIKAILSEKNIKSTFVNYTYVLPIDISVYIFSMYNNFKKEYDSIKKDINAESTWKITKKSNLDPQNVVIVIGESVRKDFLHSYGFPIQNTPFIDSSPNIQFNNYISAGAGTKVSLLRTIAWSKNGINYELNNSIFSLFKKLGYKTTFISNQFVSNLYNMPVALLGYSADNSLFLRVGRENKLVKYRGWRDSNMLSPFKQALLRSENKKLVILSMDGSHPSACDRTGGGYDEYLGSKELSCYNKTIKKLDGFLQQVYDELIKLKQDFVLVYVSDHGLRVDDDLFLVHSDKVKQSYQVPLLIWGTDIKKKEYIDEKRMGKNFIHLVSELVGVKTKNIDENYVFISNNKDNNDTIRVLAFQKNDVGEGVLVNYDELQDNPLPYDKMFNKDINKK